MFPRFLFEMNELGLVRVRHGLGGHMSGRPFWYEDTAGHS